MCSLWSNIEGSYNEQGREGWLSIKKKDENNTDTEEDTGERAAQRWSKGKKEECAHRN